MNSDLPKGWIKTTLKEIVEINPANNYADDDLNVSFIPMKNVPVKYGQKVIFEIKKWGLVKKGYTHFRNDDVILAKITPCFENGKAAILSDLYNMIGSGSTEFHVFRTINNTVDNRFLLALFKTADFLRSGALNMTGSVGQKRVPKEFLNNYCVNLPPFPEQKRIADKLDILLAKVDACKARLDKVSEIIKKFRQAVLSVAVSGKLTEEWRKGKNLTDWENTTIRKIAISMSTGPFGSMLHSFDYIENGIPVINPTNIKEDKIVPDNTVTINKKKADELIRYKLQVNDIILARRGDLSKCGIVTVKEINNIAGTGLFILRARINPYFFKYLFSTNDIQNILNSKSIGSTMVNLNQTILGDIELYLPSLLEQQEIVRRVEALFAFADQLEQKLKTAQKRVNDLTASILSKAFRGELVPQDPNDEPAEKLLERIKLQKEAKVNKDVNKKKNNNKDNLPNKKKKVLVS